MNPIHDKLKSITALSDHISVCQLDGIKVLRIIHPKATALISLFGGHVLSFTPTNKQNLLWLSDKCDFSGEKAMRGGIPICWPWFGKAGNPSHGFARTSIWQLQQHRENENGVIINLRLVDNQQTRALWDHAFCLDLEIEITAHLKVTLITHNTGEHAFNIGGALHSYLKINDINHVEVKNLGHQYIEAGNNHTANGAAIFNQEVDRVYTQPNEVIDVHQDNHKWISVKNAGHNAVVVWNPWQQLSSAMADMTPNGYQTMVCVEAAIYDQSVSIAPAMQHRLSTEIFS